MRAQNDITTSPMPMRRASRRVALVLALALPFSVHADGATEALVYDREIGELSPGTQAPRVESMLSAIDSASPGALTALLEYGEHVECLECIPKLEAKLLESGSPEVREISAWWLRKRPFGYARAAVSMRRVLGADADAVRRERAAEALGEFLDPGGVPALEQAVSSDASERVRLAAVRALGRLNARAGEPALVAAFEDEAPAVRRTALDQVLKLAFFDDRAAVVARLRDDDHGVRLRAAQIAGQLRVQDARDELEGLLQGDDAVSVRQAAAWALGRLGGSREALIAARDAEREGRVLDAIRVALEMVR